MTVAELIRLLADYPPTLRVVVNGYENGYDDLEPEQVSQVKIALNTGKREWERTHGEPDGLVGDAPDGPMAGAAGGGTQIEYGRRGEPGAAGVWGK